jgi:hypothetical protein
MYKSSNLILFFSCIFINIIPVSGQISSNYLSDNQELIFKSAEPLLFIIRQDYFLQVTKGNKNFKYGKGKNEYYGRGYVLAILADNKLWCNSSIRKPWERDPQFDKYKKSDSLKPVLSKTAIRPIFKKEFNYLELKICSDSIQNKLDEALITYYQLLDSNSGIAVNYLTNLTDGWIISAYTIEDISKSDTCNINWSIYRCNPDDRGGGLRSVIKEPPFTQGFLGGLFVNTMFSSGRMTLTLSGIQNNRLNKWYISKIPVIRSSEPIEVITDTQPPVKTRKEIKKEIKDCKKNIKDKY